MLGLDRLYDDGTPYLDQFGRRIPNYGEDNIFESSKVWTSFEPQIRRGNYEDLDWTGHSFLDPLLINDVGNRDWAPKIDLQSGYLGDQYPLCDDLPKQPFLKKGAQYRFLGSDPNPLWHYEPPSWYQDPHEVYRMTLDSGSALYNALCTPKDPAVGLPATTLLAGDGTANFNITLFGAPFCTGSNTKCDSGTLLEGNSELEECGSGDDTTSCTIDGCIDGSVDGSELFRSNGVSHNPQRFLTESVKQIVIESVGGDDLRGGTPVKIEATVISGENGFFRDRVDFYYAEDASNPDWIFITTGQYRLCSFEYLFIGCRSPLLAPFLCIQPTTSNSAPSSRRVHSGVAPANELCHRNQIHSS